VSRRRPPNKFEREVLDVVLVELRRAMRMGEQLSILIDPFLVSGGAYIWAAPSDTGNQYEIDGPPVRRRKRRRSR
jgi:hypothetical protein